MTLTRLLIARHGNTFGPLDTVTRLGKTDLPLVASGFEQGQALGRYLVKENLAPDAIFTSQLKRTKETAEQAQAVLGTKIPLQSLSVFDEVDYGPDENRPEEEAVKRLGEDVIKAWNQYGIVPPGWNIDPDAIMRNWRSFAEKITQDYKGKTVLVVTSNGIIRFSPCLTGNFEEFCASHKIKVSTGNLCILENDGRTPHWSCAAWNVKPDGK
jgi:2,3-bisphosphoglycerate-dependent phosphoglycerate mutase